MSYYMLYASYSTHEGRISLSGCTLHIDEGHGAFLSPRERQTGTTNLSTVAEFIATQLDAKEIMWARSLLQELG